MVEFRLTPHDMCDIFISNVMALHLYRVHSFWCDKHLLIGFVCLCVCPCVRVSVTLCVRFTYLQKARLWRHHHVSHLSHQLALRVLFIWETIPENFKKLPRAILNFSKKRNRSILTCFKKLRPTLFVLIFARTNFRAFSRAPSICEKLR